jgi:hypothetical protein
VHCCDSHLCSQAGGFEALKLTELTHPQSTCRAESGTVHSKVSLRRAVDTVQRWSACVRTRPSGLWGSGNDAQVACEPDRGGCKGGPVPPSITHPPYVPRPSALDHLDRDMLNATFGLLSVTGVGMVRFVPVERRGLRGGG